MLTKFVRQLLTTVSLAWMTLLAPTATGWANRSQRFPEPPSDLTRVYYLSGDNSLLPLPFEPGVTLLNVFLPAKRDETARVVLKGSTAVTVLANNNPRFYVFVADKMDPSASIGAAHKQEVSARTRHLCNQRTQRLCAIRKR